MDLTGALFGCSGGFSLARDPYVTVMRHIFLQSVSILFLTHLMIEPASVCLLILLAGHALFFCARQRSTGWAEAVATVAMTADTYELMTTLTFKNTAVLESQL
jgi:hypothetical protein